jgi:hypothetical protein
MLRAILKRVIKDAASGREYESFFTLDFNEPTLEDALRSNGINEMDLVYVQLVGIEIMRR